MSGQLTLTNTSDAALSDWSFTFLTAHKDIQVWSSVSEVVDLGQGISQVTVSPPDWGTTIPAGGSTVLNFNAASVGESPLFGEALREEPVLRRTPGATEAAHRCAQATLLPFVLINMDRRTDRLAEIIAVYL